MLPLSGGLGQGRVVNQCGVPICGPADWGGDGGGRSAWVVGLERAGRPWFHRGGAACGADRGQNVPSRFFSKCGYQLFRFWSDHGMGPPVGTEQAKFTDAFDAAFTGAVITIVRPPMRAPRATVTRSRNAGLVPGANASARTT